MDAIESSAEQWNETCDSLHQDQPRILVHEVPIGMPTNLNIKVTYAPRAPAPFECSDLARHCFPMAVTTHHSPPGSATITIYGEHGDERDGPLKRTLVTAYGNYDRLVGHELGHLLGLDHDDCERSIMLPFAADLFQAPMAAPTPEQCTKLDEIFEAEDPTETLRQPCVLGRYCLDGRPWPRWVTVCRWEQSTATVSTYAGTQFLGSATTKYMQSYCTQQAVRFPIEWEIASSPKVLLLKPANNAVVSGPVLIEGWAWERGTGLGEVKVFVDGDVAPVVGFQHGLPSNLTCTAGLDPEYCDPQSRFAGLLDTSGLAPGRHRLQIVATDLSDLPRPVVLEVDIIVNAPNHAPIAQDDEVMATVINEVPRPRVIEALANDEDPDGGPIAIVEILTQPGKGTAMRLNNGQIEYTPFAFSDGSDSFEYAIEDEFGVRDIATIHVEIMHGLFVP